MFNVHVLNANVWEDQNMIEELTKVLHLFTQVDDLGIVLSRFLFRLVCSQHSF
jgi:hypothetical protein